MSNVILTGDTSGTLNLAAPLVAGTNTQTLVAATGTLAPLISGTAVASTSGTSIDFTSIPSWVKRITVMFNGVSTNGGSNLQIQIGAGSVTTTGYLSGAVQMQPAVATTGVVNVTTGFVVTGSNSAPSTYYGNYVLSLFSGNIWSGSGNTFNTAGVQNCASGGVTLSGTLDRVRITSVNGTDTFDAGSINILYE